MYNTYYIHNSNINWTVKSYSLQGALNKLELTVIKISPQWKYRSNGEYIAITDRGLMYCYWLEKVRELSRRQNDDEL